jgi:hypothetical protein
MRIQIVSIIIERKEEKIVDNLTGGMLKRVTRRVTFKKIIVYRRRYLKFSLILPVRVLKFRINLFNVKIINL